MNYAAKRQKAAKGLKFGDRQNNINYTISTGVDYESSDPITPSKHAGNIDNIVQHDIFDNPTADTESIDDHTESIKDVQTDENQEVIETDDNINDTNAGLIDGSDELQETDEVNGETEDIEPEVDNTNADVAVENRDNELELPHRTRLGHMSKLCNYAEKFPETAHFQQT